MYRLPLSARALKPLFKVSISKCQFQNFISSATSQQQRQRHFTFSSILLQQTNTEKDDEFIVPLEESKLKGIVKELKVTESKLSTVNDVTKIFRDEAGEEVEDICEHLVSPYHQNTREGLLPLWPLKPRGSTEKND